MADELPVLDAYTHRDGIHLIAWCDECDRWHFHDAKRGAGHHKSHCQDHSAYLDRGYVLRLMGPQTKWITDDLARQSRGLQKGPYDLVVRRSG